MTEKFYITTSIPYVNAPPHVGHALEFVQADTIARFHRLRGERVFFLTGTDEHGAKIARAAEAAGVTPRKFVDDNAAQFQDLIKRLGVEPDDFIRTSDEKRHWPGAVELWRRIAEAGDIYKSTYKGLYCVGHEAFVTEKDLKNGICEDHGKPPEVINEENYFFRLSDYRDELVGRIEAGDLDIIPQKSKNEALAFLRDGLDDISFSRPAADIPWGIPVPGDPAHTMYVWCDALSNYISALGFGRNDTTSFSEYWPCDLHVIGKDILRFHAIIWPAMLLSAGVPLPRRIFVHGFIHSGGRKMSKSLGNVISPFDLVEKYGADAVRYYLLGEVHPFEDSDLTHERFEEVYTAHLANGLGNLVSRTTAMVESYFEGRIARSDDVLLASVPPQSSLDVLHFSERDLSVGGASIPVVIETMILPAYEKAMAEFRLHDAVHEVWRLIHMLDKYVQDYEPYKLIETDREKVQAVLWHMVHALEEVARLLVPFMPETAEKICAVLGIEQKQPSEERKEYTVKKSEALFPRIEQGGKK